MKVRTAPPTPSLPRKVAMEPSFFWSGVISCTCCSFASVLPHWLSAPTHTTTIVPTPSQIVHLQRRVSAQYNIKIRKKKKSYPLSMKGAVSGSFSSMSLSPVMALSSTSRENDDVHSPSAGIMSPFSSMTMSPTYYHVSLDPLFLFFSDFVLFSIYD